MEVGQYFNNVRNKRILIIGDAVVDKYIIGTSTRISPDAPVPVLDVEQKNFYVGAIGLMASYILAFGGIADICTVVGKDFEGDFLRFLSSPTKITKGGEKFILKYQEFIIKKSKVISFLFGETTSS